jgi:hypothetical protein
MFLTPTGAVQGAAEMLDAISWGLQPFRFVSLAGPDQRRLRDAIESSLRKNLAGDAWIERYRAMSIAMQRPRKRIRRMVLAVFVLATLLGCGIIICYNAFLK